MTNEKNIMAHAIPWDLHRLPGFDFMKFTQKKDIGNGKQDLFMSLEGQKTWFRLACPSGSLVLNALRVTDAAAIFEARVFADANDRSPLASFTATQKADKAKGDAYIRAAQDTALGEALKSAGFCLQIAVLSYVAEGEKSQTKSSQSDGGQPTEAPEEAPASSPVPAQAAAPTQKAGEGSQPSANKATPPPKADTAPRPAPIEPPPHSAPRPAPVAPQPHAAPAQEKEKPAPAVVNINDARQPAAADGQDGASAQPEPEAAPAPTPAPEASAEPAPATYTPDMPVEEIAERMTLEQAQNVKVLDGTCKGWTLAQVAKDRPSSLRWLKDVSLFADNELKAAATIVLNDLELRKAG